MDAQATQARPLSIAICALGGEGGGVLADWIVDLAEHGGYLAQTTSVPGVAQRTGATIYYVELFPKAAAGGREPVLALMPVPGDVDIVLASELMEAARAVQRGFVTPERTTLIASTHRVFAITEKIALADGRADDAALLAAARDAAKRLIAFDMEAIAEAARSLVSAVRFGALAGSGTLPFQRMAFAAAIRRGGVGVAGSLAAFAAGFEAAASGGAPSPLPAPAAPGTGIAVAVGQELRAAIARDFPAAARAILAAGVERLVDYQDEAYARDYLSRLARFLDIEAQRGDGSARLLAETARQLALAMSYEDTVRVAELKIRSSRFARVRAEVGLDDGQILEIAEYFHPRTQEIADTLPAALGRWLLRTGWARGAADRLMRKGRVIKTTSVGGFVLLYLLARLKPLRRRSLRFVEEQPALDSWLDIVATTAASDYELAVEVARARTLVKGYGDTHARGRAKFDTLVAALPRVMSASNPAEAFRGLITAALADEAGDALERAMHALRTSPASAADPAGRTSASAIRH
jgi:indolepyruvate ferredoxin oxidoreductase beta subunit